MAGHQLVESTDAGQSFWEPSRRQPHAVGVDQVNVVVVFCPIVSNEDQWDRLLNRCSRTCSSPRTPGGNLI
jgi:hypothetical protein